MTAQEWIVIIIMMLMIVRLLFAMVAANKNDYGRANYEMIWSLIHFISALYVSQVFDI